MTVQLEQARHLGHDLGMGAIATGDEINLRELWLALCRRRKLVAVTAVTVLTLTVAVAVYQRIFNSVYIGSFSLLITDPISSDNSSSSGNGNAAALNSAMIEQLARNATRNDLPTLIEVLRSPMLLNPIAKQFNIYFGSISSRLKISIGGEKSREAEGVLNVSFTDHDPVQAQKLLQAISDAYLHAALEQRQKRLADGLNFLTKNAPALQQKTSQLQSDLARFRERHNLIEPTEEGGAIKQRLAQQDSQLLGLEAERNRLQRVRTEISRGRLSARGLQEAISTGTGIPGSENGARGLSVGDVDQSLLQLLLKVESELAQARSKYKPNSSIVQGIEYRRRQLQPKLLISQLEAVDGALQLNAGRLAMARSQQQALNLQFLRQPALIKQYTDIIQDLKVAQENLAGLMSARDNFQLEMAQRSVPWRVIAPPQIESKPVNPSLPSNLALGAMLGLAVGAAAGLLRDRFDHVFHSSSEVKQELCLPLLGHIPHLDFFQGAPEGNLLWVRELDQPRINLESETSDRYLCQHFLCQEAFRNLFTSLRFLNIEKPLRSIAISSSLLGEGKSLVAALLAKTLAEMGQRVLLIDADMRRSQLDNNLGLNNLVGLSNLLSDECLHWRNCVQSLPGFECWHVITAGLRPPDPTRLLSSKRMRDLVVDLTGCGDYDLVLFDTSPVVGLADAVLVAENCDGLVLLVGLGLVDRGLPKQAVEIIRNSGCPLLGIVTNSIKPEGAISPNRYGKSYGSFANHEPLAYSQYPGVVMPASESTQHSQARIFPTQGWRALGGKMYRIPGKLLRWLDS
jgi:capsular exopolysaccharide synthesis family protein